jgi:hypothetical protein
MMPLYRVYLQTVATTVIKVEADDKDDAYEKAASGDLPSICAQCSGWGQETNLNLDGEWNLGPGGSVEKGVEEVTGE